MIHWSKMHTKNYDGTCVDCGEWCTDKTSKIEWRKATNSLCELEENYPHDSYTQRKINYLTKRIDEKRNYILGFK